MPAGVLCCRLATERSGPAADQARLSASHATANNLELLIKMLLLQHRQRLRFRGGRDRVQDLYHNLFINFIK